MPTITYRPLQTSDYNTAKSIICEAFGFEKWITDDSTLNAVLSLYLHGCLSEATFSSVAVQEGEVVGIILGSIPHLCPKKVTLKHNLVCLPHILKLAFIPQAERQKMSTFRQMDGIYKSLISGMEDRFQGSVALFAVRAKTRGLGIGKTLMNQLLDYMHQQEVTDLYLYTDTICNYGFYESQGWNRLASHQMPLPTHAEVTTPSVLDVFLYSYRLTTH